MKLILFAAAAARLARGDDFCVPAACRKLAPGAEDEHSMKNLVGDLEVLRQVDEAPPLDAQARRRAFPRAGVVPKFVAATFF